MTELVQVDAVDLDRGTREQSLVGTRGLGVTQVLQVGRVELQLGHRHRGQEGVVGFLTTLHDAAHVVFLGVSLELYEQLPSGGIGRGDGVLQRAHFKRLGGVVPAANTLRRRSLDVGSEFEVRQAGTDAGATIGALGVRTTGEGQEGQLVHTIGQPVGQLVAGVFTEVHDRLLVGHATFVTVGVAHLVDTDHAVLRLQTLFVTFEGGVTDHAVTFHVGEQGDNSTGTLFGLLQLSDVLDQRIGVLAEKLVDERQIASLLPKAEAPCCFLLASSLCSDRGVTPIPLTQLTVSCQNRLYLHLNGALHFLSLESTLPSVVVGPSPNPELGCWLPNPCNFQTFTFAVSSCVVVCLALRGF